MSECLEDGPAIEEPEEDEEEEKDPELPQGWDSHEQRQPQLNNAEAGALARVNPKKLDEFHKEQEKRVATRNTWYSAWIYQTMDNSVIGTTKKEVKLAVLLNTPNDAMNKFYGKNGVEFKEAMMDIREQARIHQQSGEDLRTMHHEQMVNVCEDSNEKKNTYKAMIQVSDGFVRLVATKDEQTTLVSDSRNWRSMKNWAFGVYYQTRWMIGGGLLSALAFFYADYQHCCYQGRTFDSNWKLNHSWLAPIWRWMGVVDVKAAAKQQIRSEVEETATKVVNVIFAWLFPEDPNQHVIA